MGKHTFKNYPFLSELRKEGWIINKNNKHILVASYEKGLSIKKIEEMIKINKRLNLILRLTLESKDSHKEDCKN